MAENTSNYRARGPIDPERGVIVDISEHFDALQNYTDIAPLLTPEQEARIVDYVRNCFQMSYDRISKRYDHWKEADRAHDVYVDPDTTEFRNKVVIGDTRAVADTVITYLMAALAGRNPMFQLEGTNRKSRKAALILERNLHQQIRRTAGEARIAQLLSDSTKYGFSPTKVVWDNATKSNQIINFDPRRAFPDPRVSWGQWEQMQYIGFSAHHSYDTLLQSGMYPIMDKFPGLRDRSGPASGSWKCNDHHKEEGRGLSIDPDEQLNKGTGQFKLSDARVVNELWCKFSGYQLGLPAVRTIWLLITILDEGACIRFQLNPYGKQFPVVIGSLHNDAHKTYGQGLYDLLLPMHEIATWLLRSRVDNVQAALNNLIFADPTSVNILDLIDRNPWGVVQALPGANLKDAVRIEAIPDVTRGHWNDIAALSDMKQRLSAASDAQQGMPTGDSVRTATEIARLTQLGSQRLGMLARVMSAMTIRPMVRMMVSNIQDALEYEGSIFTPEDSVTSQIQSLVQDEYIDFNISDIQGDVDYLVVDGTLPLEPTRNAETWLKVLEVANQGGLGMEIDLKRIALESIRSMGITDIEQYRIDPKQLQQQGPSPSQQLAIMEKMRGQSTGARVQSDESVSREVERGNLIPQSAA